ncbi:hypothetical protein C0J52_03565 [Blattella germanica]|nr:hypothetical protein C0J52_03565 [Blattella germanica]
MKPNCYRCDVCFKFFTRRDHLRTHEKNLHGEDAGPFACIVCSQLYKNADSLRKHIAKFHVPRTRWMLPRKRERGPFSCPVCPKIFKRKYDMTVHARNLHGDHRGPFQCQICFKWSKNLEISEAVDMSRFSLHGCRSQLSCPLCLRQFVSRANLMVHAKNEHGDDRGPFNCCDYE